MDKKKIFIYLTAFVIPAAILCTAFAQAGIYPFGNKQVLIIDAWHQYYPFLTEFRRKIRAGESLLYCWRLGMGSGWMPVAAYYLMSPLNLLFVVCPQALLREVFALMILLKIGLAGACCAFSLHRTEGLGGYGTVIFSSFYALCGWVLGYYWNIMWLDTFALFPLTAAGTTLLVKERKYKLYTLSLAAAILTNYYIGMIVCIFTVLYFFIQCIGDGQHGKAFADSLGLITLCSAMAVMMSAVVILPSFAALQQAAQEKSAPQKLQVMWGWAETLARTLAYTKPTSLTGPPNIYCGVLCIILLLVFYRLSAVSRKEKVLSGILLLVFFLSMNINLLDYVWHGLRVPNQLPYRYTFIFSYLVILAAYRAYLKADGLKPTDMKYVCATGIGYFAVLAIQTAADGTKDRLWLFLGKNLLLVAAVLGILYLFVKRKLNKAVFTLLLAAIAGCELFPTTLAAPEAVGVTERSKYPDQYEEVQTLLNETADKEDAEDFYRVEFTKRYSRNPSVLYGYDGCDIFTSSISGTVRDTFKNMGLVADDNGLWYYYQNSTPVNNMFLNLKYLISRDYRIPNKEYLSEAGQEGNVCCYQNQAYLPIGFMVKKEMADFDFNGNTPFEKQNHLLKTASGITEDVFEPLDIAYVSHENVDVTRWDYGTYSYGPMADADGTSPEKFVYHYVMPADGCAYVYMDMNLHESKSVTVGGETQSESYEIEKGNIFPAGTYQEGEAFSVEAELDAGRSGELKIYAGIFHQDVFDRAYQILKTQTMHVSETTSASIRGTITSEKEGLLYTSIPYETGWNVYVDGKKADITKIFSSFIGVMLPAGKHEVQFRYEPVHVFIAILLSLLGTGIFVCFCIWKRRKRQMKASRSGRV